MRLGLIWAEAQGGVIGKAGDMPWHLPEDLAHFKRTTMGAPVIMGRRTWQSLPDVARPLPGRPNFVVTRDESFHEPGALVVHSVEAGLAAAREWAAASGVADPIIWNIGGGELFRTSLPDATELVITKIHTSVDGGDTFAPVLGEEWRLESSEAPVESKTGLIFHVERWVR